METKLKATKDHSRVCETGKKMGAVMSRLADAMCEQLAQDGEPDTRCKTCAFRKGTVPNGCVQTQMDVLKAVSENVPFMCHHAKNGRRDICHGWYSVRVLARRREEDTGERLPTCDWDFSPPDITE